MKKCWLMAVVAMLLTGCAPAEPVMETVADPVVQPAAAEPKPMDVWVPEGAAVQTAVDAGTSYVWDGCELRLQTLTGGDIRATLQTLTGLSAENLTVMEYERDGMQMYQSVWSSTSEDGVVLGRCLVADDGNYHYCISLTCPEDVDAAEDYAMICASLDLTGEGQLGK